MTEDNTKDWPEAQKPKGESGPIYGFRRGYKVREAGIHENADQYACFQAFLKMQGERSFANVSSLTGHSGTAISKWSEQFNWQKRAAAYDREQMAIVWRQADKLQRNKHKEAIVEFREASENQAKMMMQVSEDLLRVLQKRITDADNNGEEVPMALVSGLLRAAANINEQSRQSWATALGVNEMMDLVEAEIEKVDVEDVTDVDAYDIPLDE